MFLLILNTRIFGGQKLGGFRTLLGVPLLREGTPIGVLVVQRKTVRPFTEKQVELVTTFADQAVIAIENVRLFDEVQTRTRELSESLDQQTATSEVLQVISSSPGELEPVFNAMLENATGICEAKFGNYVPARGRRLSRGGGTRRVRLCRVVPAGTSSCHGAINRALRSIASPSPNESSTSPTFGVTKAISTGNPRIVSLVDSAGARTHIVVPMLKEDELIGAIVIYRQEVRPFSDKQIELLTNFAAQAVIAIENTRLLNELRQRTRRICPNCCSNRPPPPTCSK